MVASSDSAAPKPAQHFVDAAPEGSVMVVQAPPEAQNAVWGGLMTERAKVRGVKGVIIDGKIRDLQEQWSSGMTIFAKGHSTLGQSPFTQPSELGCSLQFPGSTSSSIFPASTLEPTDLILADVDGVVFVPRALVTEVARLAKEGREVDERCKQDIVKGRPVKETFAEHRGKK
jgi:regulator of RNase E activity RraA